MAQKQVHLSAQLISSSHVQPLKVEFILFFFSLENSFSLFPTFPTEGTAGFEPSPEQQRLQPQAVIGGCMLPGQQQYPVTFEGAAGEDQLPEQPAHPKEEAEGGAFGGQLAEQFLHTMNMTSDGDHFSELENAAPPPPTCYCSIVLNVQLSHVCSFCPHDSSETQFRVSVYYRGVKVLEQLVENEAGVRLVYR